MERQRDREAEGLIEKKSEREREREEISIYLIPKLNNVRQVFVLEAVNVHGSLAILQPNLKQPKVKKIIKK